MWKESLVAHCVRIQLDGRRSAVTGAAVHKETGPSIDSFYHLSTKSSWLRNVERQLGARILPSRLNMIYTISRGETVVPSLEYSVLRVL
jgi:hypothetical protein